MSQASGGPDTSQMSRNNVPELQRAMPMKLSVKDGEISN